MLRSHVHSPDKTRHGTVIVLVTACLIVILGVVALSLDGGLMLDQRRHTQATVDAAAMAAAKKLLDDYAYYSGFDPKGKAAASARAITLANGYNKDNSNVTFRIPPTTGDHVGKAHYAEIVIEYKHPRFFSNVLGFGDIPIRARAVANGMPNAYNDGIIVLHRTAYRSFYVHGNGTINTNSSRVIINSSHSEAGFATSNALATAGRFDIVGGVNAPGQFKGEVKYGVDPVLDPLRHLPAPDASTLSLRSNTRMVLDSGVHFLQPGVYQGGIAIQGQAVVTMNPGIYFMQGNSSGGGFSFTGQGAVVGLEIMIYNAPTQSTQQIRIAGKGSVNITPPATGPYAGISFFQHRNASIQPTVEVSGNGLTDIRGAFYVPKGLAYVSGNGAASVGSQFIVDRLETAGTGDVNITYSPKDASRVPNIRLVE